MGTRCLVERFFSAQVSQENFQFRQAVQCSVRFEIVGWSFCVVKWYFTDGSTFVFSSLFAVHLEDLIHKPEEEIARWCVFLKLDCTEQFMLGCKQL